MIAMTATEVATIAMTGMTIGNEIIVTMTVIAMTTTMIAMTGRDVATATTTGMTIMTTVGDHGK